MSTTKISCTTSLSSTRLSLLQLKWCLQVCTQPWGCTVLAGTSSTKIKLAESKQQTATASLHENYSTNCGCQVFHPNNCSHNVDVRQNSLLKMIFKHISSHLPLLPNASSGNLAVYCSLAMSFLTPYFPMGVSTTMKAGKCIGIIIWE